MFNYEYKPTTDAGRVCLELSLKPFGYDKSPEGIEKVCREYFGKWSALFKYASGCSVLLWTSDGSEILEFTGNLDDSFEWCKYIGIGNWDRSLKGEEAKKATSLHQLPIHYMENPPDMTYRDLKNIIEGLKRVGKEMTGLDVKVGETFDPGPEFAYSAFKYERHPEIAKGNIMGKNQWLHCAARLHAEDKAYAAYPDGIPEGTHIGEFLGRQFMAMKEAVGFDYLWLSNGFGFSLSSWDWKGEMFDGEKFDFTNAAKIRDGGAGHCESPAPTQAGALRNVRVCRFMPDEKGRDTLWTLTHYYNKARSCWTARWAPCCKMPGCRWGSCRKPITFCTRRS